ncbi:YbhB/YbcL family Raf kinase inhibitor-like protein [Mycobacterium sp. SM1]|uniref:YbhB/YbcL family Raf kinase inhibitor-like protein n=1 Tax=Mycobacterium sp. SM1 TaxID=2816243 RepID=UPI001BCD6C34|nr:YbhB/YbcL family Raf kinase inhibitor-like protein [Mycobacterium sp. SM1]MBS4727074.1 YbhB/YbcL family Raf kinase inhibitor-like protein [Mycobacterium sp. SM1]
MTVGAFALSSSAFADNTPIPVVYACKGRTVPPPLRWENVPPGTQSLALVVDDPDAPAGTVHHYRFQLYALQRPLTLAPSTPAREATQKIANSAVAVACTVGLFGG